MKLLGAGLLGGPMAVLVAFGSLAYGEHAVVKVTVVAQRVQVDNVVLGGGTMAAGLPTRQIVASVSEQQTVNSAVVQLPASVAGGSVTFMCSPMSSCPNGYTVAAGTILQSTTGVEYRTLRTVSFPSCAPSSPVGVSAVTAGAQGNVGAGTVVYGQFPSYIHVNNPWPIGGGADARTIHMVQQSDVDAASGALTAKVSSELVTKLQVQAGGLSYLTTAAAAFSTASDAHVGDNVPTFTLTVTGTVHAIAYSAKDASGLLRRALSQKVSAGYQLTSGPTDATYSVKTTGEITGSGSGYMIPRVDARSLATAVRGQTLSEARSQIDKSVPGGAADIKLTPFALPWLPVLADHISVVVVVRGAA